MIRQVTPKMVMNSIISIQPMPLPSGMFIYMDNCMLQTKSDPLHVSHAIFEKGELVEFIAGVAMTAGSIDTSHGNIVDVKKHDVALVTDIWFNHENRNWNATLLCKGTVFEGVNIDNGNEEMLRRYIKPVESIDE
jgi:hypothetical protein